MNRAYRDFIQYALDESKSLPESFYVIDWQDFLQFCYQHSIMGVMYEGLERANKPIPQQFLYEWIGDAEYIKQTNKIVNERLLDVSKWFEDKGYRSVILKGQANGLMYPKPELRCPGDIDIWVSAPKNDIIKMVLEVYPDADYSIHHIKMPMYEDVSVEVHYKPIYLTNWFADKKLQEYIALIQDDQFSNRVVFGDAEIGVLKNDFNIVYQILHMYAHFFSTRNNFKQFIDYYYLLKKEISEEQKQNIRGLLSRLKVLKYAKGIMWVMKDCLGLDEKYFYVAPDKKVGEAIVKESMRYGSFSENKFLYTLQRFTTNIHLIRLFPSQVLISPIFFIWHQLWKKQMLITMK